MSRDGQVILSKRLRMLADMVTPGNIVADVGCDHAHLSIWLVQNGISPRALAMDVRREPLSAAREHIRNYGLEAYIETRLSDGMAEMKHGEAQVLVCAGMGGRLMEKILSDSLDKAKALKELILQPQSELGGFRGFLRREGFRILEERAVFEGGKYYFAMRAFYAGKDGVPEAVFPGFSHICDEYGGLLLKRGDSVLRRYLVLREKTVQEIAERLEAQHTEKALGRLGEIRQELEEIRTALRLMDDSIYTKDADSP